MRKIRSGFPICHSLREHGRGRQILRLPFRLPCSDPSAMQPDLGIGQTPVSGELAESMLGGHGGM